VRKPAYELRPLNARDHALIARTISVLEGAAGAAGADAEQIRRAVARSRHRAPVIGITGTGGAGKSSLTDELLGAWRGSSRRPRSRWWRWTRRAGAAAARCSAIASA